MPNSSMTRSTWKTPKDQRLEGPNLMDSNLLTTNNVTTEPDAAALVAEMKARGIRFVVYRKRGGVDIVLRPYRLVTDADRAALREASIWDAVTALVLAEEERASSPMPMPIAPSLPAAAPPTNAPTDDAWFDIRKGRR